MGERSNEIELQIREKRNELSENLNELEQKVKSAMDWREQFRQHPGALMAVAFGGGAFLAALLPSRGSASRYRNRIQSYSADHTASPQAAGAISDSTQKRSEAKENLDALRGAVVGIAVNRLTGLMDGLIPGFQQEFARSKNGRRNPDRQYSQTHSHAAGEPQNYESPEYGKPS